MLVSHGSFSRTPSRVQRSRTPRGPRRTLWSCELREGYVSEVVRQGVLTRQPRREPESVRVSTSLDFQQFSLVFSLEFSQQFSQQYSSTVFSTVFTSTIHNFRFNDSPIGLTIIQSPC